MIPEFESEILARWDELGLERPRPENLSTMKLDVADYPDPIKAILLLVFADQETHPCLAIKIARIQPGNAIIELEAQRLQQVRDALPEQLLRVVPRLVLQGRLNQRTYFMMTTLPGVIELHHTWGAASVSQTASRITAALTWALELSQALPVSSITLGEWVGSESPNDLVNETIYSKLSPNVLMPLMHRLEEHWETRWPASWSHGDFFPGNIFFNKNQISGIIDWSFSRHRAPIFFDVISYELSFSLQAVVSGRIPTANEWIEISQLPPFAEVRREIQKTYDLEIGPGSPARLASILMWSRRMKGTPPTHYRVGRAATQLLALELEVVLSKLGLPR